MNVEQKMEEWLQKNSSPEFFSDMEFYHNINIKNLVDFLLEANLEKLFKDKNIDDITINMVEFSESKFVLNTGNEIRNFWFRIVDEKNSLILFEKDIGINRRKI